MSDDKKLTLEEQLHLANMRASVYEGALAILLNIKEAEVRRRFHVAVLREAAGRGDTTARDALAAYMKGSVQ